MDREIWNHLIIFAEVSRQGSFTKASNELGVSPSAISHVIRKLEDKLDIRLLHRSTRSLSLTEEGARLLEKLGPSIVMLNETISSIQEAKEDVSGKIKLTSHRVGAEQTILSKLADFSSKYPHVNIELDINDGLIDFIAAGFDAGIRRGESLDQDMIAVPLDADDQLVYVASPQYLESNGVPQEPRDVLKHQTISYRFLSSGSLFLWPFHKAEEGFRIDPLSSLILNDADLLVKAALTGFGIACVTERQAAQYIQSGQLQKIFSDYRTHISRNYLYFSGRRHIPAALRVFIDFMKV